MYVVSLKQKYYNNNIRQGDILISKNQGDANTYYTNSLQY